MLWLPSSCQVVGWGQSTHILIPETPGLGLEPPPVTGEESRLPDLGDVSSIILAARGLNSEPLGTQLPSRANRHYNHLATGWEGWSDSERCYIRWANGRDTSRKPPPRFSPHWETGISKVHFLSLWHGMDRLSVWTHKATSQRLIVASQAGGQISCKAPDALAAGLPCLGGTLSGLEGARCWGPSRWGRSHLAMGTMTLYSFLENSLRLPQKNGDFPI